MYLDTVQLREGFPSDRKGNGLGFGANKNVCFKIIVLSFTRRDGTQIATREGLVRVLGRVSLKIP